LSQQELLVLAAIAYYQPISRGGLGEFLGREVSRDLIGRLRALDLIAVGPRSPQPGAPYTFVTTKGFLSQFGLDTLRDLPDLEQLEEAGLLSKDELAAGSFAGELQISDDGDDSDGEIAVADSPYGM
jgi:chromosome segregation and condensation protein ScpB